MNKFLEYLRSLGLNAQTTDLATAVQWARQYLTDAQLAEMERKAAEHQVTLPGGNGGDEGDGTGARSAGNGNPGNGTGGAANPTNPANPGNPGTRSSGTGHEGAPTGAPETDPVAAERARQSRIRELAPEGTDPDLVNRACNEGWTLERTMEAYLQANRSRSAPIPQTAPSGHTNNGSQHRTVRALQIALAMRSGVRLDAGHLNQNAARQFLRREDADAQFFCRMSHDLSTIGNPENEALSREFDEASNMASMPHRDFARMAVEMSGRSAPYDTEDLMRSALSTTQFTTLLGATVHLLILQGFEDEPNTIDPWVFQTDVPDFRDNKRAQMHGMDGFKKLPKNGGKAETLNHKEPTFETYAIERHAGVLRLDERFLTDDTFNIGGMTPQMMGARGAQIPQDLVYALLLKNAAMGDGTALFHADHGNLFAQTLDSAGVKVVRAGMPKIMENGRPTNIRAAFVLTGEDLSFAADQLYSSVEVRNPAATSEMGTKNVHQNRLRPVSDARLDTGVWDPDTEAFVAGKPLRWYTAADRNRRAIELGWRLGTNRRPRVRRFVLEQGEWGLCFDAYIDVGAKSIVHQAISASDQP